jgi:hypothetical protein
MRCRSLVGGGVLIRIDISLYFVDVCIYLFFDTSTRDMFCSFIKLLVISRFNGNKILILLPLLLLLLF